jgi:hypothetical protein|nr:MAG TPA: hypothetical protein [Caudoviricetes sp.]
MSNNWPTAPLIRVIRGRDLGELKENMIAARIDDSGNYIGARCVFSREVDRDSIDEWEEVTAVPTAALKRLRDERGRETSLHNLRTAIDDVLESLPADKPSALDRAVTDTKNIGARGIIEDFTLNDRISLLLAAVRDTHTGEDLRYRLAWIVRLAYTWADLEDPSRDALEEISEHAARILTEGRVNQIDVANLTCWVGDIAAAASGEKSPRPSLIVLGARALAWAAEIIEEEDK